ncbi:hypothetical protein [Mucilaginibacter sp.]|uniref:hypothetical protein n=1 Tax=Mucilaginibacter sp. TaxID=1882438 RepID=UPI0025F7713C|nr:hypothetical protein [Mucilaginibacter sp.]
MKKILLLFIVLALRQSAFAGATEAKTIINQQTDSLSAYTGKFKMTRQNQSIFLQLDIVNNELVATQVWDGEKLLVKHISGDKFMVAGFDWPVKFIRGADGDVIKIIVSGTGLWVKEMP